MTRSHNWLALATVAVGLVIASFVMAPWVLAERALAGDTTSESYPVSLLIRVAFAIEVGGALALIVYLVRA